MKKIRDLSAAQFMRKARALGFKPVGFLGYFSCPPPLENINICADNAGTNRRAKLAYLIEQNKLWLKKRSEEKP